MKYLNEIWRIVVKIKNVCNSFGWESIDISDIFNCYSANINETRNARKQGEIYKTFEFILT